MLSSCTPLMAARRRSWRGRWNGIRIYAKMREALLSAGLKDVVAETSNRLDADDAKAKEILKCGPPTPLPDAM